LLVVCMVTVDEKRNAVLEASLAAIS